MSGHLFWKPGQARPAAAAHGVLDREPAVEAASVVHNPNARLSLSQQRVRLPIFVNRRQLLYMVETLRTTVVVGHTGCGKTTQIPQFLHEAGWTAGGRLVCCTQPRRVAATSVATRVAEEMHCALGDLVGYSVRFDNCAHAEATRLKFVTDGMLLAETMVDPLLSKYSVVMVDEAHERSLHTDVLLGLLKKVMRRRPELRLIVASATVDAEAFRSFFATLPPLEGAKDSVGVVSLHGSGCHPVELNFLSEPVHDYLEYAAETAWQIHKREAEGDVLVFLTGQQEVDTAVSMLTDRALSEGESKTLWVLPLYAALPSQSQLLVFERPPRGCRKVVIATNVAETSITIEGIVYVVDCGFIKQRFVHPGSGQDALVITAESQANAKQRMGRAGRVRPGKCFVLMPEDAYHGLTPHSPPEMQRTSLASVVLQLKALGVDNPLRFDFLAPPPPEALAQALEHLFALGALDARGGLTKPLGERMAQLPLDPPLAKALLAAEALCCVEQVSAIAALLSLQSVFTHARLKELNELKRPFAVYEGDALTVLNVYRRFNGQLSRQGAARAAHWCRKRRVNLRVMQRAAHVQTQLCAQLGRWGIERSSCEQHPGLGGTTGTDAVRRALAGGFFASAAQRVAGAGRYQSIRRQAPLVLNPNSILFQAPPEWIIFHQTLFGSSDATTEYVMSVELEWLVEAAPHFYQLKSGEGQGGEGCGDAGAAGRDSGRQGGDADASERPTKSMRTTLSESVSQMW